MLSKLTKGALVFAVVLGLAFSFNVRVFAEGDAGTTTDEVASTTDDLEEESEVEDAHGILPTNPFYFFKEFSRGFRRFFIFDPLRRAEFEFEVLEEKAEELEVVEMLNPNSVEALNKALENYNENIERLRERLEKLAEGSDDPKIDELLERLEERADRHNELFDDLIEQHEELIGFVNEIRNRFEETIRNAVNEHRGDDEDDDDEDEDDDSDDSDEDEDESDDSGADGDEDLDEDEDVGDDNGGDDSDDEEDASEDDDSDAVCIQIYDPVCGKDGKTYSNECFADSADVDVDYEGACQQKVCIAIYDPVCGEDGKTYSNECFADIADVDVDYDGVCQ